VVAVDEITTNAPFGTAVAPVTMMVDPTGGAQDDGRLPDVEVVAAVNVIVVEPVAVVAMPVALTVSVTGP
jgi:hypothetical protein